MTTRRDGKPANTPYLTPRPLFGAWVEASLRGYTHWRWDDETNTWVDVRLRELAERVDQFMKEAGIEGVTALNRDGTSSAMLRER